MAETSLFWSTGSTGDGASPYTQSQLFQWLRRTHVSDNYASEGPLRGYNSELAVTAGSGLVTVGTGAANVYGIPYENDASLNVSIPTPAAQTRIDRIVLRASWSAQTVRITRIAGTEGAGEPALTQTANTTWDIPLASVSVTTGGVITVTDERVFAHFASAVRNENLDALAITDAKVNDVASSKITGTFAPSKISPQGSGSGLNADQLDSQDSTYFLARANHTGTQAPSTISPQGSGSGLNADTLDGVDSTGFATVNQPAMRVYHSLDTPITNVTTQRLTFNTNRYAYGGMTSDTTGIKVPSAGRYRFTFCGRFAQNGTGGRAASIRRQSDSLVIANVSVPAASTQTTTVSVSCEWDCAANDVFEVAVFQDSGGTLNLSAVSAFSPEFSAARIP